MRLPPLTLVPAGAGSGKTHRIQETLGAWIEAGHVAPERIVAVTFTEAAASELRERIRARLLDAGRAEDARRLDEAYISTIHGFGLRVLGECAFEAGLSPRPRKIDEAEEEALIRLALARAERADVMTRDLGRFGYRYDPVTGKGPEGRFRARILDAVRLLRTLDGAHGAPALIEEAGRRLAAGYGVTGDAASLGNALHDAVCGLLGAYPEGLAATHATSKAARRDFERDHRRLREASDRQRVDRDWALWEGLRELRVSMRGAPVPADYETGAARVMETAAGIERHPGPLEDARAHLEVLIGAGAEVLERYAEDKRAAGLLDYTDMIALAWRVLGSPETVAALAERVDCLVIDEFQDTNPLQFALLWRLHAAGVPALVVGDLKQAIMGFQGADPRLLEALEAARPDDRQPLTRNWRSQPALMDVINALGAALFPGRYQALEPQVPPATLAALTVVESLPAATQAARAHGVAAHVAGLLADPDSAVRARHGGAMRPLLGSDVAVLCPTHAIAAAHAQALRANGVRARLPAPGWLEARSVQLALAALAYLADPGDRHAALYLAVTELGDLGLTEALDRLIDGQIPVDPVLEALDTLVPDAADWPAGRALDAVVDVLDLHGMLARWPDAAQARANLLRLQTHAREFQSAERGALEAAGYHGGDLRVFLAWVDARGELEHGQPPAAVVDEDAVEVVTWHAAKGREWPVTVVCGLDRTVSARLPDLSIAYDEFEDLDRLLEHARVEFTPAFAARGHRARVAAPLQQRAEAEAHRLLYVALTRARDQLVLAWPGDRSGRKHPSYGRILADAGIGVSDGALRIVDHAFAAAPARHAPERSGAAAAEPEPPALAVTGRRALRPGRAPDTLTPDAVSPSTRPSGAHGPLPDCALVAFGAGLDDAIGSGMDGGRGLDGAALGTVLHRCFEVLGPRPDLAGRMEAACGVAIPAPALERIAACVATFETWLQTRFAPQRILREVPFLDLRSDGAVVTGTVDLVVETPEGLWVLDHKSDATDDPTKAYGAYHGQLRAYALAVAAAYPGRPVLGTGVHWIRRGAVVLTPGP